MKFSDLYQKQIAFQNEVLKLQAEPSFQLPQDDVNWFSYHIQAMVEELGEVMKADKRWKTHRNKRFDIDEKLDEIADVFITVMNIAIFSGISAEQLELEIHEKINENMKKLKGEIQDE